MMKFVVLSVMVACAMGMNMPNMGMMGGLLGNLKGMMGNMDPDSLEAMVKDLDPAMMKDMLNNIPPQMMEMVSGMGFTKEDMTKAVEDLPNHMDEVKGMLGSISDKGEGMDMKSQLMGMLPVEMKDQLDSMMRDVEDPEKREEMMKGFKEQAGDALKEFGLTMDDVTDLDGLMPKLMGKMKSYLKDTEGADFDFEDPEQLQEHIKKFMYQHFGFSEDEDPEKIKEVLGNYMKESLAPIGIDFDIENPTASFEAGKNMLINKAREFGFDIKDGSSGSEIKEVMFGKLKDMGIDLGNPSSLMQFAMEHMDMIQPIISQFMGGMMQPEQQQQQMMPMPQQMPMAMPMQMQMPQQAQPMQQIPLNLNLEINVAQPPRTTPRYMHGDVSESAVEELMQDLIHYRMEARVLAAKNEMLEHKLRMMRY